MRRCNSGQDQQINYSSGKPEALPGLEMALGRFSELPGTGRRLFEGDDSGELSLRDHAGIMVSGLMRYLMLHTSDLKRKLRRLGFTR